MEVTRRALTWQPAAIRDLRRIERATGERIIAAVRRYAATGHGDVKRLRGTGEWEHRLRVGAWRVRFQLYADRIVVLRVLPRAEAYR